MGRFFPGLTQSPTMLKLFLAEDHQVTARLLAEALTEKANLTLVKAVQTEQDGKEWLAANPDGWDIAVVDLFLREGTGAGIVRHGRNRQAHQKVVVVTNHPLASLVEHCKLLGADNVFEKGVGLSRLVAYCNQVATDHRERGENGPASGSQH